MVTASLVKELREKTGAGMMDCKKVLTETDGDMEKAMELLRERGIAKAAKKSGRVAAEGLVEAYISEDGKVGAVVETPSIYLDMTARDNLKHQYDILGVPSYEGVEEILSLVGLEDTQNKKAKNFSLGMRQRLGIAVALCGNPDLLVLDEPINGLDPQGIIDIRELILKLNRERKITVIISSHILDELSKLATHYGFIDKGRIVREMSAEELTATCRKCIRMTVSDIKALSMVLDDMGVEYKIINESCADVYAKPILSDITRKLDAYGCDLITASEHDESLESFYISLVGGDIHE